MFEQAKKELKEANEVNRISQDVLDWLSFQGDIQAKMPDGTVATVRRWTKYDKDRLYVEGGVKQTKFYIDLKTGQRIWQSKYSAGFDAIIDAL